MIRTAGWLRVGARVEAQVENILQQQASVKYTHSTPRGSSASGSAENLASDATQKSDSSSGASGTAAGVLNLLFSGWG